MVPIDNVVDLPGARATLQDLLSVQKLWCITSIFFSNLTVNGSAHPMEASIILSDELFKTVAFILKISPT